MLGALRVDALGHERLLLGSQRLEALRAHGLHHVARHVDPEHPDPLLAREQEDVPVVVPVVAPAPIPVRLGEKRRLRELLVGAPAVEPRLLRRGRGVHLEPHQHLAAARVQLLDHPKLHAVELHVGVAFADEDERHAVETCGELRRRDGVAARGVGDAVDDERRLPVPARGITDRKAQRALVGAHDGARQQERRPRAEPGRGRHCDQNVRRRRAGIRSGAPLDITEARWLVRDLSWRSSEPRSFSRRPARPAPTSLKRRPLRLRRLPRRRSSSRVSPGARSGRSAAGASPPWPASRASRSSTTWARPAAACGRRPTPARAGRP